ncbi:MAG: hypothetical protein QM644_21710 [Mobilitalea sp.]
MTEMELTRKIASVASQVSTRRRKIEDKTFTTEEQAAAWADYDAKVRELGALRQVKQRLN